MNEKAGKKQNWIIKKIDEVKAKQKRKRDERLKLWGDIGYHRYLGGDFYNQVLMLFVVPVSLLVFSLLTELLFPDPSVKGYEDLTKSLLGFFFGVMDIGLAGSQGYMSSNMVRFVAEHAEMNPRKALKQIQFFITWQMFTGLIQVTAIGIYCFTFLIHTTFAHMILFIIAYSFVQYPGILQIFESLFQAFQRYDMEGLLSNVRDSIFSPIAQITCVLLGKYIGSINPIIGETMGITIGFLVSIYVADIIEVFYGARLFNKTVLKNYDYKVRDFFRVEYSWKDVKEIISFIGPIQFLGIGLGFLGLITTIWITQWVDAYASWKGLLGFASTVAGIAMPGGSNKAWATVSEAWNNGKKYLTYDYIEKIFKYHAIRCTVNLLPVMVLLPMVLSSAIDLLDLAGLSQYTAGIVAVPIYILTSSTGNIFSVGDRMLVIDTRRNVILIFNIVSPFVSFFFSWLLLVYFDLGWLAIPLYGYIPHVIMSIIKLTYVFRKVIPNFRLTGYWQIIIAPVVAAFGMGAFGLFLNWVSDSTIEYFTTGAYEGSFIADAIIWIFVLILAFLIFIGFPIIYQIFYSLAGGWDEDSLEEFRKGVMLAGPSTFMVKPMYVMAKFFSRISPLYNKFPIKNQDKVQKEIRELIELRAINKGK
ncbi:MAG: hypothetical protein ACFFCS_17115 [Candidatus Hodarchaeota archaeon]